MRAAFLILIGAFAFGAGEIFAINHIMQKRTDEIIRMCVKADLEPKKCAAIAEELYK